jgi:para-nitrobenzyl esterase
VPLSGSSTSAQNKDYTKELGTYILKEAKLTADKVDQLQQLPWREYLDIANAASRKMSTDYGNRLRVGFSPIADGVNLPAGTFFAEPLPSSPDIPMIFCTTFNEQSPSRTDAVLEEIGLPGVVERLQPRYGDKAEAIVNAYAKLFPDAKPIELLSLISSNRKGVVRSAEAKVKQSAPVWMAWFGWQPPLFDARMRAFHCLDICFWFLNTDHMYTHTGGGSRPRRLSRAMATALVDFMKNADPNGPALQSGWPKLPEWPKFTPDKGELMILNDKCEVKNDPDREARNSIPD